MGWKPRHRAGPIRPAMPGLPTGHCPCRSIGTIVSSLGYTPLSLPEGYIPRSRGVYTPREVSDQMSFISLKAS